MAEKLSPHFTVRECKCPCCGLLNVSPTLLKLAEKIRTQLKAPMHVHSVCRCVRHNREVGGRPKSRHLLGHAMDFHVPNLSPQATYNAIIKMWAAGDLPELGGVFVYDWGVHIDIDHADDGHLRRGDYRK